MVEIRETRGFGRFALFSGMTLLVLCGTLCSNLCTVVSLRMRASVICVLPLDIRFITRAIWFCVSATFNVYRPEDVFVTSTRIDPHLLGMGL